MEGLKQLLKKTGWISILESLVFGILGAIVIWKPEETIKVISYVLGIIFITIGILKIINYFLTKEKYDFYNYDLIYGLMTCVLGIVTIVYSNTISSILRIIIGIWIIYSSFIRMNLSLELRSLKVKIWIYSLILAIVMLMCGLFVIMNSGTIITTIGIMMVVYSVIDIVENVIFMRNVKDIL